MQERTVFFIHHTARPHIKEKALRLSGQTPDSRTEELKFPFSCDRNTKTAVIVGGDGSVGAVSKDTITWEEQPTLVVVPGGSRNAVYKSLKDKGTSISEEQLKTGEIYAPVFRPGLMNNQLFNHACGWDKLELLYAQINENIRNIPFPRSYRVCLASALTIIKNLKAAETQDYLMRMALTSSYLGPIKVAHGQEFYSDKVTLLSVKPSQTKLQSTAKLGLLLVYFLAGKKPPTTILSLESADTFNLEEKEVIDKANIDGQMTNLAGGKNIVISRSTKGLKMTALKFT